MCHGQTETSPPLELGVAALRFDPAGVIESHRLITNGLKEGLGCVDRIGRQPCKPVPNGRCELRAVTADAEQTTRFE